MDPDFIRNALTFIQIVGGGVCFLLYRAYLVVSERAARVEVDLAAYKLHVAETYLTNKAMESILAKLDRIEDKLDNKQDKAR
jgi:hypothetical protein